MAQYLKWWESPRKSGRNHKGRGGTARQRQLQKRQQTLRQYLSDRSQQKPIQKPQKGEQWLPFLLNMQLRIKRF